MGAILFGTFMVSLDQTIISVALPRIGTELHGLGRVDLVMTDYLLALGVVQPTTGWLADRFGRKRIFLASLAIFTLGSLLSGLAADLPQLILRGSSRARWRRHLPGWERRRDAAQRQGALDRAQGVRRRSLIGAVLPSPSRDVPAFGQAPGAR